MEGGGGWGVCGLWPRAMTALANLYHKYVMIKPSRKAAVAKFRRRAKAARG